MSTIWLFLGIHYLASFHPSVKPESRQEQDNGAAGRLPSSFDGLMDVLFSTIRAAYSPPPSLAEGSTSTLERIDAADAQPGSSMGNDIFNSNSLKGQLHSRGQDALSPGCNEGYGGGMLGFYLAEQCGSLLRELYKVLYLQFFYCKNVSSSTSQIQHLIYFDN